MLTLCTLLPSDNEALLGRSNGFYAPLLIPSDNIPILLRRCYAAHYIECASNIIPKYILPKHNIPKHNIQSDNIPKYIFYSEKNAIFGSFSIRMCDPPLPKKMDPLFTGGPNLENGNCQK